MENSQLKYDRLRSLSVFALAVSILISGALVYFHPAYRYYKDYSQSLRSSFDDFRRHVDIDILSSVSNLTAIALSAVASGVGSSSPSIPPVAISNIVADLRSDDFRDFFIVSDFRYNYARSSYGENNTVTLHGWEYSLGDKYLGSPITYISPSCVQLSNGVVLLPPVFGDLSQKYKNGVVAHE